MNEFIKNKHKITATNTMYSYRVLT